MDLDSTLQFGEYVGLPVSRVLVIDPEYLNGLDKKGQLNPSDALRAELLAYENQLLHDYISEVSQ